MGTSDDVGWLPFAEATIKPEIEVPDGDRLWKGSVSLPEDRKPGQFRLLIEELETYQSLEPGKQTRDRVIFAETVEL